MSHQPTSPISSCQHSHRFVPLHDGDSSSDHNIWFPQVGVIDGEFREVFLKGRCCNQIMRLSAGTRWQVMGKHHVENLS